MRKQIVLAIASFVCWCAPVTGQQQIRPGARTLVTGTRVTVNNGPGRTKRSARERRFGLVNHRCHRADYPLLPKYHET